MILVTGATGNVGSAIVAQLAAAGHPVRALTRDPTRARVPDGAQVVAGDLERPETLANALAGVRAAHLLLPRDHGQAFVTAAVEAGVERIVVLSSSAADYHNPENAICRAHQAGERVVRDSGLAWTFLRPGGFASNALAWAPGIRAANLVRAPFVDTSSALIDPRDIAAVGVAALTQDGHAGKVHTLTGPKAYTVREQVAAIGAAIGREIRLEALTEQEGAAEWRKRLPAPIADALLEFAADQRPVEILDTVREVTGRPGRTFAEWADDHADEFRAAAPPQGEGGV